MKKVFKHENGNTIIITDKNHLNIMERYGYVEVAEKDPKTEQKPKKKK